jgi:hypothetical protein
MPKSSYKKPKEIIKPQSPGSLKKPISAQSLRSHLVLGFFLFVFTLAVYQPVWNEQQIWDDNGHIAKPALPFHPEKQPGIYDPNPAWRAAP